MDGLLSGYIPIVLSYAAVAIVWLTALAILHYTGLAKRSIWGTRCMVVAAVFSLFVSVFHMLAEGFSTIGQTEIADVVSKAAIVMGGTLSWIFGIAGCVFMSVALLMRR